MPKWIERVEITRAETTRSGFWESRGYAGDGTANIFTAILSPHPNEIISGVVMLNGIAFSGHGNIEQITFAVDDSASIPLYFSQRDPFSLAHWSFEWTPPHVGDYVIRVSAARQGAERGVSIMVQIR
jgi:hypothetical protein